MLLFTLLPTNQQTCLEIDMFRRNENGDTKKQDWLLEDSVDGSGKQLLSADLILFTLFAMYCIVSG